MYEQDWLMRQIKMIIDLTSKIILSKKMTIDEEVVDWKYRQLTDDLDGFLKEGNIDEAENILFKILDGRDFNYFKIGLAFYDRINDLGDTELEESNFSRSEIGMGLKDLFKIYGMEYME